MQLAATADVAKWCADAESGIIKDKSSIVSRDSVTRLLQQLTGQPDPRIVHTSWRNNATHNSFAVIHKETRDAALLMSIPSTVLQHDGYWQGGPELPRFDLEPALFHHQHEWVWRSRCQINDRGQVSYWDGHSLYHVWDGQPAPFDYYD